MAKSLKLFKDVKIGKKFLDSRSCESSNTYKLAWSCSRLTKTRVVYYYVW